jgi:hypothetical protein
VKKLYEEFFFVPEDGKVSEKVMLTRAVLSVAVILVCLSAMGFTAYAYFAHSLTSGQNTIKAADFGINVTIQNDAPNQEPVVIERPDKKTQAVALLGGNTYSVTVEKTGTASTGYCVIYPHGFEDEEGKYHTQQLGADVKAGSNGRNTITFTLTVTEDVKIYFYPRWGTSTYYTAYVEQGVDDAHYILDGETVTLP